jgi:hypothetical protein
LSPTTTLHSSPNGMCIPECSICPAITKLTTFAYTSCMTTAGVMRTLSARWVRGENISPHSEIGCLDGGGARNSWRSSYTPRCNVPFRLLRENDKHISSIDPLVWLQPECGTELNFLRSYDC